MYDNRLKKKKRNSGLQIKGEQFSPNTCAEECIIGAKLYKLRCKFH